MRLTIDTPVGKISLAADDRALTEVAFAGMAENPGETGELYGPAGRILLEAQRQLTEYFSGERRSFDFSRLPIRLSGTEFTKQVGRAMLEIPYGEVRTYGEIAERLGRPKAVRAVGGACHRNPICLFIPCHRVIGAGKRLTGFGGGTDVKKWLLIHEGVQDIR